MQKIFQQLLFCFLLLSGCLPVQQMPAVQPEQRNLTLEAIRDMEKNNTNNKGKNNGNNNPAARPLDSPEPINYAEEVQFCWRSNDGYAEFELRPDFTFWYSDYSNKFYLKGYYQIGIVDVGKQYWTTGGWKVDMSPTIQIIADDQNSGRQIFWIDTGGSFFYWQNQEQSKWSIHKIVCTQPPQPAPKQPEDFNPYLGDNWRGNGSGFVIHTSGLIVTNRHVVEGASEIEIEINGKKSTRKYKCVVVDQDPIVDIAVIQIIDPEFTAFPALPYKLSTTEISSGTKVYALGFPKAFEYGSEIKVTSGIVSATTGIRNDPSMYTLSVPIQPGNSGGPLLDMSGNLIGINTSKIISPDVDNISYAIKSKYIAEFLSKIAPNKSLPVGISLKGKSLQQQVEIMSEFVPMIKIK